ncbi:MAG: hypothetical protein PHD13_03985 [Methanocellales archaeon]|nr:hypothetical protein [Methanocellales archaeon]MDD3291215.1 hypothetical protein [Methanocellales archaeon]MDD5235315.1 hypothetical protein [Methanocellales archaeon]MDD5484529.1 hypothetical protein [Methanocellales archaeon]
MTDTRRKLEEAKYFLDQMGDKIENPRTFAYNLSAFLSATRSVTFIMQYEFKTFSEFDKWYKNKQKEMENDDFKLFNELRVKTIHLRPILPICLTEFFVNGVSIGTSTISPTIKINGVTEIIRSKNVSIIIDKDNNVVPRRLSKSPHESKVNIHREYYIEEAKEDILKLCSKHLARVEKLVEECEKQFHV